MPEWWSAALEARRIVLRRRTAFVHMTDQPKKTSRSKVTLGLVILLLGSMGYCFFRVDVVERENSANRQNGQRIVAALESYRAKNKSYPRRLLDLVPSYLPQLPTPVHKGQPWGDFHYRVENDLSDFELSYAIVPNFTDDSDEASQYSSRTREWSP